MTKVNKIGFVVCIIGWFSCSTVRAQEIWGVWNPGQPSNNVYTMDTVEGTFKIDRSTSSIVIVSDFLGKGPEILYNGGNYKIIKIIGNSKTDVFLYIEEMQLGFDHKMVAVNAKIVIHFIDENHMWIEIDYDDPEYPTPQRFRSRFFGDKSRIYWREKIPS